MKKNVDEYKPGRLLENHGRWMFVLSPENVDELSPLFLEEWGYEPSGHSWGAVIEMVVDMHAPELVPLLTFDAEGDECWIMCSHPEPLQTIAQMLRMLTLHPEELRKALQQTEPE